MIIRHTYSSRYVPIPMKELAGVGPVVLDPIAAAVGLGSPSSWTRTARCRRRDSVKNLAWTMDGSENEGLWMTVLTHLLAPLLGRFTLLT